MYNDLTKNIYKNFHHVALLILLCLIIYLFGENLFAKWWLIDDHEIFRFLGNSTNQNIWADFNYILINKTEIGSFGNFPRYRPSYYILRLIETFLWKDNSIYWYAFRLIVSYFFVVAIYLYFNKLFTKPTSLLIALFVILQTYFNDIFSRLGPGEFYCILGLLILFYSFYFLNKKKITLFIIFSTLGSLVSIGSKENFLFLAIVPFFIIWKFKKRLKSYDFVILSLPFLYAILIFLSLFLTFQKGSSDIYGNSVGIGDRLFILFNSYLNMYSLISILIIGICSFIVFKLFKKVYINIFYIIVLNFFVLSFNIVFYNGDFPQDNRYDFPGVLSFQIIVILFLYLFLKFLLEYVNATRLIKKYCFEMMMVFILLISIPWQNASKIYQATLLNKQRTNDFSKSLLKLRKIEANTSLILLYDRVLDFEPVDSFNFYLNYWNVKNSKSIYVNKPFPQNPWEEGLVGFMENVVSYGNSEMKITKFDLMLISSTTCAIIYFHENSINKLGNKNFCKNQKMVYIPF